MREITKIFKALSDPNRVRILKLLEKKPICVCEFPSLLNIAVSTVSKHLSILRDAGLITDRKSGKWVIYSLNTNTQNIHVRQILSLMPMWLNEDESIQISMEKLNQPDSIVVCNT
jgi:ArsR family transcriptional regulator, arsenate/arsenite/antimonite-responsive transcriptional repressor